MRRRSDKKTENKNTLQLNADVKGHHVRPYPIEKEADKQQSVWQIHLESNTTIQSELIGPVDWTRFNDCPTPQEIILE